MGILSGIYNVAERDLGHALNAGSNLIYSGNLHGSGNVLGSALVNDAHSSPYAPQTILNTGSWSLPKSASPASSSTSSDPGGSTLNVVNSPNGMQQDGSYYTGGSGGYTGGNGTGGGQDYSAQIGSLDAQSNLLQNNLGYADTQLTQGLANLAAQYNQQKSSANQNHSYSLQDFQTKQQQDDQGHQQAIDQVNTKARTLANSVRQMLGNAAGSGSSAYQVVAPDAVARQANLQSQDINNNFGQNANALNTAKTREQSAYDQLLSQLDDKNTQAQNGLRTGIAQQKQQISGTLADLAAQRAAYLGGGVAAAQAAAKPFESNIATQQAAIDNIANSYKSPFQSIAPVQVAAPTLRDYVTGQTNVATNQDGTQTANTPVFNPLATWQKQDQNQYAF